MIKFNQKAWLKPYLDMDNKLKQKWKTILWNILSSWWIMHFLEKLWRMWENIELLTTERSRNLASEPSYYTFRFFTENLWAREMRKTQTLMNKPVYLGLSILDLYNTVMYNFGMIM